MSEAADRPVLDRVDADAEDAGADGVDEVRRRRRPTGEPPPLPAGQRWRGYRWGLVAVLAAIVSFLALAYSESESVTAFDLALSRGAASLRSSATVWIAEAISGVANEWSLRALRWGTIVLLIAVRRFRHLFVFLGAILIVEWGTALLNYAITRPRPMVPIVGVWEGFSHPSRPVAGLAVTLIGMRSVLIPPGRWRRQVPWLIGGVLATVGFARVLLGVDHVTDVLVAAAIGAGTAFVMFRLLAPTNIVPVVYRRGETAHLELTDDRIEAIRTAVRDQLGADVAGIELHGAEGSAGSTPLRLQLRRPYDGHETLFAKLMTRHHLRSDRSYKLGRLLLYGQLEDEAPFTTIQQLVQYEDHLTRVLRDGGLPVPDTFGIVEITPGREYLMVFEFLDGGQDLDDVGIDDDIIDQGLQIVQQMWAVGVAHRDVKPGNLMLVDGQLHLIDAAFAQIRPTPWRQAVDLGAMMLLLALGSDAETVYSRALEHFSEDEIAEAFAATRGFAIPGQLRERLDADGRDLLARFQELAPERAPIRVHRWGRRRVLAAVVVLGVGTVFGLVAWASFTTAGML